MVLGHDLNNGKRTQDVQISEDVSFKSMLLKKNTLKGLKNAGFIKPSPIQLHGIPLGKCGFDLLLEAKSGTGKTAVFAVIALEKLNSNKEVQTIILAPTREIASQIYDVITVIGYNYDELRVAVVMGGLPVKEDLEKLKNGAHIVVGSPGRLRHLIQDKHIDVSSVRLLVLDEADKLMEKSFLADINYIFSLLPKQKQVIMSSATYAEETRTFIGKYVQKAQHVCPDSNNVLLGIEQKVTIVPFNSNVVKQTKYRYEELKKILSGKQFKQCLIFCNYQVRVGELHRMLSRDKWPSEQLYGQQDQNDRLDALKTLQEYKCRILVSTDLAARGIDASNVDLVINFEPPFEWQTYLHRIGRAGRYGSYGIAISILSDGKEKIKFKETLGLTNIPFLLKDFWTDSIFNLNNTEDSFKEKETSHNTDHEAVSVSNDNITSLWKALTKPTEQIDANWQGISSFEVLCDSFRNLGDQHIESFSDLMGSFIDNNNTSVKHLDNFKYKHVENICIPVLTINIDRICQQKKTESLLCKVENIEEPIFEANKITVDSESEHTNRIQKVFHDKYRICYENSSDSTNIHDSSKQSSGQKLTTTKTENDLTQALIEANLPTEFGKVKQKNNCAKAKSHNTYDSNNNNEKHSAHKKCNRKKKIKTSVTSKIERNDNNYFSVTSTEMNKPDLLTDGGNKNIHSEYSKPTIRGRHCRRNSSDRNVEITSECSQNYLIKYKDSANRQKTKLFDDWYQQLRQQTQFIQYTMYLQELRHLY